jgi:translation initiation factor IF-3
MPTRDALELAMDRGMDLIEVAPTARPPVCRVGDYGRLKYDRKKREAEARKNRSTVQLKEIKVRPKTDGHDMAFKIKNAMRFLGEGNKVKITVRFRGREHAHHDIGAQQCMRLFDAVQEYAMVEMRPRMEGRQMTMIIAPNGKPIPKLQKLKDEAENPESVEAEAAAEAEESADASAEVAAETKVAAETDEAAETEVAAETDVAAEAEAEVTAEAPAEVAAEAPAEVAAEAPAEAEAEVAAEAPAESGEEE